MNPSRTFVMLVVMIIALPAASALTSVPVPRDELEPTSHMLALYHMNSQRVIEPDETPNGNDAVIYGAISENSSVFVSSLSFSGSDFLAVRNVKHEASYNLSFRLFVKVLHTSNNSTFWSATQDGNTLVWLGLNGTRVEYRVRDDTGMLRSLRATRNIQLSRWVHITAIFNGYDNYMGLFYDGSKAGDSSIPTNGTRVSGIDENDLCHATTNRTIYCLASLSSASITIGATFIEETLDFYNGSIDELAIYDTNYFNTTSIPPPSQSKNKTNFFLVFFFLMGIFTAVIALVSHFSGTDENLKTIASTLSISFIVVAIIGFMYPAFTTVYAPLLLVLGLTFIILYICVLTLSAYLVPMGYELALPVLGLVFLACAALDAAFRFSSGLSPFWVA